MTFKKISLHFIFGMLLVFSLISLYWLSRLGLESGNAYLDLIFIGLIFILVPTVAKFVFKADFKYIIPISKDSEKGSIMFLLGMLVMGVFISVSVISGLEFYSPFLMAPLAFGGELQIGAESFQALKAATSPFWSFFTSAVAAPVVEEIVLGIAFMLMGAWALGLGLRKFFNKVTGMEISDTTAEWWDFIAALTFSIIMFSVLHWFNGTYLNVDGTWKWNMFAYAAGFRLVLNAFIYKVGYLGILFGIGAHNMNNDWVLGWETIKSALFSFPGGIILLIIVVMLIIFTLISIKNKIQDGEVGELFEDDFITEEVD